MKAVSGSSKTPPKLIEVQEALRQSEELHRIILTNISDSVFLTDDEGRFTFICPNVDNIFGYPFKEIYAMENISALIGGKLYDPERLEDVSELRNIERSVADKGGAQHTVLINVKKVDIKYGSRLFTCRDITEYKRVKEELNRNILYRKRVEKDLALFFNLSADLFSITDRRRLRKVNPAWTALLGYMPGDVVGMPMEDLIHHDDLRNTLSLEKRLRAGDVVRFENRYRHKDGTYRWVSWNSTMSDEGQVHAVGRDITAKKKEEDEIKRRLLKFRLQGGRTYLVRELTPVKLTEAFRELLDIHYPGLVVSRRGKDIFSTNLSKEFKYRWLSDKDGESTIRPDPRRIEALVEALDGEQVVVIDSVEYLIHKCGFGPVLSLVGHLREIAFFRNHIVLLGADGSCLNQRETRLLEKETLQMERYPKTDLPEDALQLLRKVYEENSQGVRPTRTMLCRSLGLSQPTVRKRLAELKARELLWESRAGRSATVEMTEKGRLALER
jgi:PAS domain S-box-containing protein